MNTKSRSTPVVLAVLFSGLMFCGGSEALEEKKDTLVDKTITVPQKSSKVKKENKIVFEVGVFEDLGKGEPIEGEEAYETWDQDFEKPNENPEAVPAVTTNP